MDFLRSTFLTRLGSQVDSLLRDAGIVTIGVILSGGINYGFQLFMGRALGPEEYGVFGALFALTYLLQVFSRGIRFASSRHGAKLNQAQQSVLAFHSSFAIRAVGIGIVLASIVVLATEELSALLGIGQFSTIIIVALSIPFSLLLPVNIGLMEGTSQFKDLAGFQVIPAVLKLGVGAGLVLLGYGIAGAFLGIFAGVAVAAVWSTKRIRDRNAALGDLSELSTHHAYRYLVPATLAGLCFNIPGNVDVILVQGLTSDTAAGYYTAASVLGKSLIFLVIGLTAALFPAIARIDSDETADQKQMQSLFKRGMGYSVLLLGSVTAVYALIPKYILVILYGGAYANAAPFVRWYAVAIFVFCLALVILNFELARSNYRFVVLFSIVSISEVIAMIVLGGDPIALIQTLLAANTGLVCVGGVKVGYELWG